MAVDKLNEAASILKQVDVTDIITSLALGIADAQEKLDNNSIQQLSRLSEQEIAGRSLLELGFMPAFYAFEYADVSASIHLQMALKTDLEIGLNANANFLKDKGYSKEQSDQYESSKSNAERTEYKSSRDILTYVKEAKVVKVGTDIVNINHEDGSIAKIEITKENLRSQQTIDRVHAEIISEHLMINDASTDDKICFYTVGGYALLSMPEVRTNDWGLLKIGDYNAGGTIAISGTENITVDTDLATTMGALSGFISTVGIGKTETLTVYFDFDKDIIDFEGTGAYKNTGMQGKLRVLSLILNNDSTAKISITGHTDSSGRVEYNKGLGQRRANAVKNYLSALCVEGASITAPDSKGEEEANDAGEVNQQNAAYRKVEIKLTAASDYIYVEGGDFKFATSDAVITDFSATPNGILKKIAGSTGSYTLKFKEGDDEIDAGNIASFDSLLGVSAVTDKYYTDTIGEVHYLLNKEAQVHFTTFSKTTENLEMEEDFSSGSSTSSEDSKMVIGEIVTKESILKKNASSIKDPSHLALSGSVDFRFATQFNVSAEGNAAVSARLKAVPPPSGLIDYINEFNSSE